MTKLLLVALTVLATTNTLAGGPDLLSCMSGGFAYNHLKITDDGARLHFVTDGYSLTLATQKLQDQDRIQSVAFSLPKANCDLERVSEGDMGCSANKMGFTIEVYNSLTRETRSLEDEIHYPSLVLRKVSNRFMGEIKLLITTSMARESLYLSNDFTACYTD